MTGIALLLNPARLLLEIGSTQAAILRDLGEGLLLCRIIEASDSSGLGFVDLPCAILLPHLGREVRERAALTQYIACEVDAPLGEVLRLDAGFAQVEGCIEGRSIALLQIAQRAVCLRLLRIREVVRPYFHLRRSCIDRVIQPVVSVDDIELAVCRIAPYVNRSRLRLIPCRAFGNRSSRHGAPLEALWV